MSNPYRLSSSVAPRAYRLRLVPDLESATFAGTVEIDVDVAEPVDAFALNAAELEISPATLRAGGVELVSSAPSMDDTYETATFSFAEPLAVGAATVSLSFTGVLNDQLRGFYLSTFHDDAGVEHRIATTQFEATDARRAFPCWDEPAFKATFDVTLVVPSGLAAFSNGAEVASSELGDGRREVQFATTMVMSTYVVAFVVGPFEASAVALAAGTPLRVVFPTGKGHLAEWAAEVAVHAMEFFTDYFAIPYPGDKIDLLAVPDFAAGAMENLGCVIFRETELLIDPAAASQAERQRVAMVIGHELAHMWFGDLVTMDWWEGIWLNEAFATFMEMLCTNHFRPEWKNWVGLSPFRDRAFLVDGQHSTRPVEYKVVSPDECRGMFDVLTYVKGCLVLRMLEQYLGADTFRDGIRVYLARHAYANAVTADLWSALESASGEHVGSIMDTWILQGGHPLVTVEGDTISQTPFAYADASGASAIGTEWKIPVIMRSLDGGEPARQLLDEPKAPSALRGVTVVNAGGYGFYRTAYAQDHVDQIAARLGELEELERAVLFSDTWASILVGRSRFADVLHLAEGLGELNEPAPWTVVAGALRLADRILDDAGRASLAVAVRALCGPVLARLGWDPVPGEPTQAGELRALVVDLLGTIGEDPEVIAEATSRFDAGHVTGDLADAIVAITVRQGRPGDIATCEQRRKDASTPQEERRYLFAPARSLDADVLIETFEHALVDVRMQDASSVVGLLAANRVAGPEIWRATTARWEEISERFPPGSQAEMTAAVMTFVADAEFAAEVRRFHEDHPVAIGQQQITQFLDLMDLNVAVAERNRGTLEATLRAVAP